MLLFSPFPGLASVHILIKFSACLSPPRIRIRIHPPTENRTHRSEHRGDESADNAGPEPGTGARQADVRVEGTTDHDDRQGQGAGDEREQQSIHRGREELSLRKQVSTPRTRATTAFHPQLRYDKIFVNYSTRQTGAWRVGDESQ